MNELLIIVSIFVVISVLFFAYRNKSTNEYESDLKKGIKRSIQDYTFSSEDTYEKTVNVISPLNKNAFRFFEFVSTFEYIDQYYEGMKEQGYEFPPDYESAILYKLKHGYFDNPYTFPEYYNSEFDYIAIDFETANNSRISACAVGLVFVKDNKIVHSFKELIKPPSSETFLSTHTRIHNIRSIDVKNAKNFKELWDEQLSKYLLTNLIICHNTSMDISIMSQLATYYNIDGFDIEYIDTMVIAKDKGLPTKLESLALHYNIKYSDLHDPENDAKLCVEIFNELQDVIPNLADYKRRAFPAEKISIPAYRRGALRIKGDRESNKVIRRYRVSKEDMDQFQISGKAFLITGQLSDYREAFYELIESSGGVIKKGVSSKVDYVIVGEDYGWAKIDKVDEYNSNGKAEIKFLNEDDFNFGLTLIKNK